MDKKNFSMDQIREDCSEVELKMLEMYLNRKKQKEIMNFRKNLEVGQSVVTAGGIYGKIKELEDNVVVLEIAAGVKIRIDRNSIFADMASTQNAAK